VNIHELLDLPEVERDMRRLEGMLAGAVTVGDPHLDAITTHLIHAGGKRLRPLLAVTAARGGAQPGTDDDLMGGIALELMHLASLYHDDVMDEADIRRNVDSVNARYGNLVAIVAGDYLMARSAAIAADLGVEVASLLAHTLAELTRGQVSEVRTAFSTARTLKDYYEAIEGKTASLMASSCRVGAITAQRPTHEIDALTEFGRCFGMVFQLRDDILDFVAVDGQLGKPAGQDLAEGIYNLPCLVALGDATSGPALRDLLGAPLTDEDRETARTIVVASGGIQATYDAAYRFVDEASAAIGVLHEKPLVDGLRRLVAGLLDGLPAA
jgi:heptaprenyl diphosphate synthase